VSYFEKNEDFSGYTSLKETNVGWMVKHRMPQKTIERFTHHLDYVASLVKTAQSARIIRDDFPAQKWPISWL